MRTEEIKIYKFDELSDEAKERAREWYREGMDDFWMHERQESYQQAEEIYDALHSIEEEISGARLYAWIENNLSHIWDKSCYYSKHIDGSIKKDWWSYKYDCIKKRRSRIKVVNNIEGCPLTGVTYDYDFLLPIIEFMKKPDSSTTNLDLELPSYRDVAERDWEYMTSDEAVDETLEINDYEFTEDGNIY